MNRCGPAAWELTVSWGREKSKQFQYSVVGGAESMEARLLDCFLNDPSDCSGLLSASDQIFHLAPELKIKMPASQVQCGSPLQAQALACFHPPRHCHCDQMSRSPSDWKSSQWLGQPSMQPMSLQDSPRWPRVNAQETAGSSLWFLMSAQAGPLHSLRLEWRWG